MIVTLSQQGVVDSVRRELTALGLWVSGVERSSSGLVHIVVASGSSRVRVEDVERIAGVSAVSVMASAHPKIDAQGGRLLVAGVEVSRERPALFSGPCSVESEEQIHRIARKVASAGARFLRGGAFKPRTSPYSFQGAGHAALGWMRDAASASGLAMCTEVMSEHEVDPVGEVADVLQIGSRNMHNYALLKAVGKTKKPVLLKRSMAATVSEWLLAGEYLLAHGSSGVLFCERGIRGFDDSTRNLLDLGAVALLAHVHDLPVIVDPSHATGRRDLVVPLAKAALAAGAAGVMIESHDEPARAESDGAQALDPNLLHELPWAAHAKERRAASLEIDARAGAPNVRGTMAASESRS